MMSAGSCSRNVNENRDTLTLVTAFWKQADLQVSPYHTILNREDADVKEFYFGMSKTGRRGFTEVKSYKRWKRWLA